MQVLLGIFIASCDQKNSRDPALRCAAADQFVWAEIVLGQEMQRDVMGFKSKARGISGPDPLAVGLPKNRV
jgi:hypothetical protein